MPHTARQQEPHDYIPRSAGQGTIMPIGGAEEKDGTPEILATFVGLAGGNDARIALIPTASEEPADAIQR